MKKIYAALAALSIALGANAQTTYKLDSTYNADGIFSTNGPAGNNAEAYATGSILNNDGTVWLSGGVTGIGNSSRAFYIARQKANGTPDSAFCTSGSYGYQYTSWNTLGYLLDLHALKNGGVYASHTGYGGYYAASTTAATVSKEVYDDYDPATIYASAAINDSVIVQLGGAYGLYTYIGNGSNFYQGANWLVKLRGITTQSNQQILVYGWQDSSNYYKPFIMRLKKHSFSELDSSFGVNGISYAPGTVFGNTEITAHYVQSDNKIILHNGEYFMRINADGTYDASFGYIRFFHPDNGAAPINARKFITNSTNTEIYGICQNSSTDNFVFAGYTDGQALNSFHNGKNYFRKSDADINYTSLDLYDISINNSGDLLVAGTARKAAGSVFEIFTMKLKAGVCVPVTVSVQQTSNTNATVTVGGTSAAPYEVYYLVEDPGITITNGNTGILTIVPGTSYTVTVVDANGCVGTTVFTAGATALSNNAQATLAVYPNPAKSALSFSLPNLSKDARYSIVGIDGKLVQANALTSNTIDIATLKPGIYFLQIKDAQQQFATRFIKE
jgi:hypothetical protein